MLNRSYFLKRLGGGKSVVKSISYSIILFLIFTTFSISSYTVRAARKKTATVKRAASLNKNTKVKTTSSKSSGNTKRAAISTKSTKQAVTSSASRQRIASRSTSRARAVTTIMTTTSTTQTSQSETEAQKLKAEAERRKAEEEKRVEEARLKAESEKKRQEEEAKAKAEAEAAEKQKQEEEKQEAEEKRLLALRIKKVEGTEDDYTCIDGWTNYWALCNTSDKRATKCNIGSLMSPEIMNSDGIIKETITEEIATGTSSKRNISNRGKKETICNAKTGGVYCYAKLKGCPVKTTEILTLQGMKTYNDNLNYFDEERVFFYDKDDDSHTSTTMHLFKQEMEAKDITNDPKTGWTDEENLKWKGFKPVIGMYYLVTINRNDIYSAFYKTKITDRTEAIKLYNEIVDDYLMNTSVRSFLD